VLDLLRSWTAEGCVRLLGLLSLPSTEFLISRFFWREQKISTMSSPKPASDLRVRNLLRPLVAIRLNTNYDDPYILDLWLAGQDASETARKDDVSAAD